MSPGWPVLPVLAVHIEGSRCGGGACRSHAASPYTGRHHMYAYRGEQECKNAARGHGILHFLNSGSGMRPRRIWRLHRP